MRIDGERLTRFRQKVRTSLLSFAIIAVSAIPVGCLLYFFFPANLVLRALGLQCIALGLAFSWHIFRHRSDLLQLLKRPQGTTVEEVTAYFLKRKLVWDRWYPYLLVTGILIALGFLYSTLFTDNRHQGQLFGALIVSYLLGMIVKNTLDFMDRLLLQDFRHDYNDHSS